LSGIKKSEKNNVFSVISVNSVRDNKKEKMTNSSQQQTPPTPTPYMYLPEEEINLLDYLIVILKHKWRIIYMVIIGGLIGIIYSVQLSNIYRSEATIVPRKEEKTATSSTLSALRGLGGFAGELIGLGGGGSIEKFELVLKSRILARRMLSKHRDEILPALYEETWDKDKKIWTDNPHPTTQDITIAIGKLLNIQKEKSGVLKLQVDFKNPVFAKRMVEHYIIELSESLREETLKDAEENQRFLKKQLEQTPDVLLKEKIYTLLAKEIEKETFASAQKYYSFMVLDPPIVPDLNKRIKPKRRIICILSVTVAFFTAVFFAFFIEYIHNLKTTEDPERLEKFKKSIKLRNKP